MRSRIPVGATPWEQEKWLRVQAQQQAHQFHRCFDEAPIACQRIGYVGVGMSLGREGDIRETWIARSTFKSDCDVSACMAEVAKGWFFEPLAEPMRAIVPVQVLRTSKPLPSAEQASLESGRLLGAE